MNKTFTERAFEEYLYWQIQDKKVFNKINKLIKSIERDGAMKGEGKPERLKYNDAYSRRIDDTNRLVYMIANDDSITVKSCKGHYED